MKQMITDSLLTQEDLRQIESILYREKEDELVGRQIFSLKTDFTPGAEEIGFDGLKALTYNLRRYKNI